MVIALTRLRERTCRASQVARGFACSGFVAKQRNTSRRVALDRELCIVERERLFPCAKPFDELTRREDRKRVLRVQLCCALVVIRGLARLRERRLVPRPTELFVQSRHDLPQFGRLLNHWRERLRIQDIAAARIEIKDAGRTLQIAWRHDDSVSVFPAAFLWNIAQDEGRPRAPHRTLWDRDTMGKDFPSVRHEDVMGCVGSPWSRSSASR